MTNGAGSVAGKTLLAGAIVVYPLAVYFLIDSVGPAALGGLLVVLLLLRYKPVARVMPGIAWFAAAAVAIAVAIAVLGDGLLALKAYPTIVSLGMLAVFASTLFRPPSMIERIARAGGGEFSTGAEAYMRAVTLIWCCFFAANALVSAMISLSGSLRAWTLYNGVIAYGIVGLLLVGEILFRREYMRRQHVADGLS